MKGTITQITRYTTGKDGTPLVTKDGRPYTRTIVKLQEYGDKLISGFGNAYNAQWKEGDQVDIIVEQKGEYLNFTTPKKEDATKEELEQIKNKLTSIVISLEQIKGHLRMDKKEADYPDFPDVESMPEGDNPF